MRSALPPFLALLPLFVATAPAHPPIAGDCRGLVGDELVDARDVLDIARIAVGADPIPASPRFERCDAVADGRIDVRDVRFAAVVAVSGGRQASGTGVLLTADWGSATGNSSYAVSDAGRGTVRWCAWNDILSVQPGGPVGWARTRNVLAIRSAPGCGHVEFENVFPSPSDGQQQFWAVRYYIMNEVGQTDTKMHPLTFWPVGAIEAVHMGISTFRQSNGNWVPNPRWPFVNGTFPFGVVPKNAQGQTQAIPAGAWIRYEFILHWLNASEYRWYPRVYDSRGYLLWDEYDFRHTDTNLSLGAWYDASPSNVLRRSGSPAARDHIRTIAFGMGQAGSSYRSYYVADVALALVSGPNDFLGP